MRATQEALIDAEGQMQCLLSSAFSDSAEKYAWWYGTDCPPFRIWYFAKNPENYSLCEAKLPRDPGTASLYRFLLFDIVMRLTTGTFDDLVQYGRLSRVSEQVYAPPEIDVIDVTDLRS